MTDIELMLLAAKAAGIRLEWIGDTAFDCTNLKPGKPASKGKMWWPLVDDGDALRLAVKLGIQPVPADDRCEARWWGGPLGTTQDSVSVITNSDRYIATRRAIVLAAAEIGKAVQKPLAP